MKVLLKFYMLCATICAFQNAYSTALNGSYTINYNSSATSTNFQNFYSANAYLTGGTRNDGGPNNSAPFGVSGPVIFKVASGTYGEQFVLSGSIPGVSPTHTITYDGGNGNASSRVLTYSGSSSSFPTVIIDSVPYVTIRNITIKATNTSYAFGVLITGKSNGCVINNCIINVPINVASNYVVGIVIGGSVTDYTASGRLDSLQIDSNLISGGYLGITFLFSSTYYKCTSNKIRNNQFLDFYYIGMYLYYQNGMQIMNNIVKPTTYYAYNWGIYSVYLNSSGTNPTIISGNKITHVGYSAIVLFYSSNSGVKGFINNNMLGGGLTNAYDLLYVYGVDNLSIANNSINYDVNCSTAGYAALWLYGTNVSVMNNSFSVKQSGNLALPLVIYAAYCIDSMDYNIFYRTDTSDHQLIYVGGNYNSGNFIGASGFNQHSMYLNPMFVNDTTLYTTIPCNHGITLPYISKDIDGNTRNSPPNIGANEVQLHSDDAATLAITQPSSSYQAGLQDLSALIINYGSSPIMNVDVSYKLNGNSPVTQTWYGYLNPCDTATVTFSGSQRIKLVAGSNNLKVYTSSPNSVSDGNKGNDTTRLQFTILMSGQYIIGPTPSDYTSFNSAVTALKNIGIGGSVEFLAKTGTYNESITLTSITGADSINSISFSSLANDRDSVLINNSSSSTSDVLDLSNASFISFKNISFNQSSASHHAIVFSGTVNYDTLYNCKITSPSSSGTGNGIYSNLAIENNLLIRKCLIQGGNSCLNLNSTSTTNSLNCVIDSNTFQGAHSNLITLVFFDNLKVKNNQFNIDNYNNSFLIKYSNNQYDFSGNTLNVSSSLTANAYLAYYSAGTSTDRIKIYNNYFYAPSNATLNLFAPYYHSSYVDFYNNSIITGLGFLQIGYYSNYARVYNNSINSSSTTKSVIQNVSGNTNVDCKNNVISNTNGGVAVSWTNTPSGTTSDYNNLYSTGSNLIAVGSTNYTSLSSWRAAYGMDKNSLTYLPGFTSSTDLLPSASDSASWSLNGRAMPQSFITTDINGNSRSASVSNGASDIGAYEFTPTANPPLAVASPSTPSASTTQYFSFGNDTIASIFWGTSVPSSIHAQLYSGKNVPIPSNTYFQTNAYWYFNAPAGIYSYNLKLNYKKNWLYTIPSESNMVIAQNTSGATNWGIASTTHTIDTINNIMSANGLSHISYYTGTDASTPLPVKLVDFTVDAINNGQNATSNLQVLCKWKTASEVNNNYFEVLRSVDGLQFAEIGKVAGAGNSNLVNTYQYTDVSLLDFARSDKTTIYYRLKQVDLDGNYEYSKIVSVNFDKTTNNLITIFPNPVSGNDNLFIKINSLTDSNVTLELLDITGKSIITKTQTVSPANNTITFDSVHQLQSGVYFLKAIINENVQVFKVFKN
jgi:trimeric autotransporter adhesin